MVAHFECNHSNNQELVECNEILSNQYVDDNFTIINDPNTKNWDFLVSKAERYLEKMNEYLTRNMLFMNMPKTQVFFNTRVKK